MLRLKVGGQGTARGRRRKRRNFENTDRGRVSCISTLLMRGSYCTSLLPSSPYPLRPASLHSHMEKPFHNYGSYAPPAPLKFTAHAESSSYSPKVLEILAFQSGPISWAAGALPDR